MALWMQYDLVWRSMEVESDLESGASLWASMALKQPVALVKVPVSDSYLAKVPHGRSYKAIPIEKKISDKGFSFFSSWTSSLPTKHLAISSIHDFRLILLHNTS